MASEKKLTLVSLVDGSTTVVDDETFTIGREAGCNLQIPDDPESSPLHAQITRGPAGDFLVHDSGTGSGTFVNGERVTASRPLPIGDGDELMVGLTRFTAGTARISSSTPASSGDSGKRSKRNPILIAIGAVGLVVLGVVIASGGGGDEEKSNSELIAEARPSTVLVVSEIDGERTGNGSGWVYDADKGLIVTNAHVVDGGEQFEVGVYGDPQLRTAKVMGVAPCDDLAVLKVSNTEGLRTLPLASQSDLEQGDRLITLGYPGNGTTEDEIQVTDGVISVVQTRADEDALVDPDFAVYPNVVQTDAAINGGNSGGPSISSDGKLIGVNTLASTENQNQNFAIGVDRVKELVPTMTDGDSFGWAGFGFRAVPPDEIASAGLPDLGGGALLVTSVIPGTGAEDQKIFVNDLVTTVNGEFVETRKDYCSALRGVKAGDVVKVEVADSVSNYTDFYNLDVPFE